MSARLTWQPGGDSWKGSFGRRKFLAGAAALGAGLATAGCAGTYDVASGITGSSGGDYRSTLVYWNLFTGGDGTHMQAMEAAYTKAHPEVDLQSTILQWGSPYYTKLSLAIRSGSPPDVASPAAGADRAAVPRVPGSAPDQHLLGADSCLRSRPRSRCSSSRSPSTACRSRWSRRPRWTGPAGG